MYRKRLELNDYAWRSCVMARPSIQCSLLARFLFTLPRGNMASCRSVRGRGWWCVEFGWLEIEGQVLPVAEERINPLVLGPPR